MMKKYLFAIAAISLSSNAFSQEPPKVKANINAPMFVCDPEACTTLTASLTNVKETTGYDANAITYQNLYPYTGGTVIPPSDDDVFGPAFPLGFNFCFYGNTYSSVYIGSNGVISFDTPAPDSYCQWNYNTPIPDQAFPIKNAIYGVYQDTDIRTVENGGFSINPAIQNVNYYTGGIAPNRYLVVNFNQLPQFVCGSSNLQTSQVVLYESTNIIDVYVLNRTSCDNWNGGKGLIGVQNAAGTLATVPTNRNTGDWEASNEAWRFVPNGNDLGGLAFQWQKNGELITGAIENTLTVCNDVLGTYDVTVFFTDCSGIQATVSSEAVIEDGMAGYANIANPLDLSACSDDETAVFDLTANTAIMLNAENPAEYEVLYYNTYQDAVDYASNSIPDNALTAYVGMDGEEIYARIINLSSATDCAAIKSFELEIEAFTTTPEGDNEQDFEAGDTLEDLEVEGDNVSWWDAAEEGNELPETTPLVDGVTYYAASTNENGCPNTEGRMAAQRLAVTVTMVTLGTPEWSDAKLTVAPNPVKDVLSIDSKQNIASVAIYNLIGQRVLNVFPGTPQAQINMAALPAGTYIMKVQSGDKVKSMKVVKE